MFSKNVYVARRNQLRKDVSSGLILMLGNQDASLNYPANTYHFRQDSNFLYFFGHNKAGLAAIIDVDNGTEILFGNDVDIESIIWMGTQEPMRVKAENVGIANTEPFDKLFGHVSKAIQQGRKIHFAPPYRAKNIILLEKLLGIHPSQIKSYASLELIKAIVKQRSVKDEHEIAELEKASNIGYLMHTTAMKMTNPGVLEQEIAGVIEGIAISKGNGTSFPVILSVRGETLHNHDHSNIMKAGQMLLIDAGATTNMDYSSDHTRTVPVDGRFTPAQKDIYEIVVNANMKAIEACRPGITYKEVHMHACRMMTEGLKGIGLMRGNVDDALQAGAHALFFPHGLGHMLGLDVHDMEDLGQIYVGYDDEIRPSDQFGTAYLRFGRRLQVGFALTVEPGIYFIPALIEKWKNEGLHRDFINYEKVESYIGFGGVRIEDGILITQSGCKILGTPVPKTVKEVETFMQG
ncbi:MAG TPA: aminopeptidase P family protein [Bacteroidales bacterium]|nr:aminopeptidase P family protein [Bacteroidales bacterium]